MEEATFGILELKREGTCGSPLPSLPAFPSLFTQIECLKSTGVWFPLLSEREMSDCSACLSNMQ